MASLTLKQHTAQDKKLTEISKEITLDGALLSQAQHLVIVTTKWNLVILFLASNCPAKSRLRIIPSTSAKKALAWFRKTAIFDKILENSSQGKFKLSRSFKNFCLRYQKEIFSSYFQQYGNGMEDILWYRLKCRCNSSSWSAKRTLQMLNFWNEVEGWVGRNLLPG